MSTTTLFTIKQTNTVLFAEAYRLLDLVDLRAVFWMIKLY